MLLPLWEHGLKPPYCLCVYNTLLKLLPLWEHGLKPQYEITGENPALKLLPLWEHGLKRSLQPLPLLASLVAPFMGAWIETD